MKAELDVLIKTYRRDLEPFKQVQRGLARYSKLSGKVWVVVPARDVDCFRNVVAPPSLLVADEYLAELAGYPGVLENNWRNQQLIKMLGFLLPGAGAYLVLDSNTLLLDTLAVGQFRSGPKWVYEYGNCSDEDFEWERQTREFLDLPLEPLLGFRAVNQVFDKGVMRSLTDRLAKTSGEHWITALQARRDRAPPGEVGWTEFNLYGLYAKFLDDSHSHCFRKGVDPLAYRPGKDRLSRVAASVLRRPPRMMKVYKARPRRALTKWGYRFRVAVLKLAARAARLRSRYAAPAQD